MKLKEMWQGLISAFKLDCYTHKGDELNFPAKRKWHSTTNAYEISVKLRSWNWQR